jgi:uncharacterized protein (TIGR00369 family)
VTDDRPARWLDLEQRYPHSPIHASLGLTLEVVAPGEALVHYDGTPGGANSVGRPSGALLAAMVDSAVMQSVLTRLEPDDHTTTLELKINYLRGSAAGGALVGRGSLEHLGRTTAMGVARITDAADKVVAVGTVTASIRRA